MLLHDSRRAARSDANGDLILLEDQDRSLWNRARVAEGLDLARRALASRSIGPYAVQAAIAAVHAEAMTADATDWGRIVSLYELLQRIESSPVVALNHAVVVAMRGGPQFGLALVDGILASGALADYHLAHAARAEFLRRLERNAEALASYRMALDRAGQAAERRFLERRISELTGDGSPADR